MWVEPVAEARTAAVRSWLGDSGLTATSMSRVGFLTNKRGAELAAAYDAVRATLDMCVDLSIPTLSFVAGGLPADDRSIRHAEARVRDAFETLQPEIAASGGQVMLEPIHPLFGNDRSIVTTVGQALRIVDGLPVEQSASWSIRGSPSGIPSSRTRSPGPVPPGGHQINNFALPLPAPNNMRSRLQPGDGVIDLVAMTRAMFDAGFTGPVEVEIFDDEIWARPLEVILAQTVDAYDRVIGRNFGI